MSRQYSSPESKRDRNFTSQPSLHIGIMRVDPWNEFLQHRPLSSEDLLNFHSSIEQENREMQEKVSSRLTVIAGERAPLPAPPLMSVPDFPVVSSFLFQPQAQTKAEIVVGDAENAAPITHVVVEEAKSEEKSIWGRMQDAFEGLRKVSQASLPGWFENEQSLVIPTDPEVRQALGSIYGGTKTRLVVTIRAIEAIDVPALDFWGTSDPYVTACLVRGVGGLTAGRLGLLPTIGDAKSCTPIFGTLNPKWNETIALDPADLLSVISDSVLHVSLWDKDLVTADEPVGFTTVSLIDALEASGVAPYPILPIQITGSLIGPHAGVFVKLQLRMVQKVGVLSMTPVALQGFTRGWKGYSIRLEVKVTASDPIASSIYLAEGLAKPESTSSVIINDTGHAVWPKTIAPITLLFSAPKKSKPFAHITLKTDAVGGDAGQIAVRIGLLERLGGIAGVKLNALDGSPPPETLSKCLLYTGVDCDLID